jgi:NADH-quinone oxidoreductase subunit F
LDLHLIPGASASEEERRAVDEALEAGAARHLLLPALHAVQKRVGWISPGAINHICTRLDVPPAEAYGVATFYAMLAVEPRPPLVVHVCDDIACRTRGAEEICAELERQIGASGSSTPGARVMWSRSPCLGQCERAPAALVQRTDASDDTTITEATVAAILTALDDASSTPASVALSAPQTAERCSSLRLLRRVGVVDPESLDDYRAHGGYAALRRALQLGPERVIREVIDSSLVGRGGAAFPAGRKWDAVAHAPARPHYAICNADESEPGTFKDRVLMEHDPFAVIESLTIAGLATGCETGFIYIRGEYPLATRRLASAIAQARARGLLGEIILGEPVRFDIELRRGAGAYICGEETAIFNSIEGFRGEPRNKPPFPTQAGLFGRPTLVNNVETLVNVIDIVLEGAASFTRIGTPGSTGTKLFCLSGAIERPGVYEVSFGVTLRELMALGGGVRGGAKLQAVLLGGAAGVFVTPDEIDVPLTFEGARAAGVTLGSGVAMVFDDSMDLRDILMRIAAFFRDESCGQCVPCRVGTVRQEEALRRAFHRPRTPDSQLPIPQLPTPNSQFRGVSGALEPDAPLLLIDEVGQVMRDASICGLGHTASSAVQSAIRKFRLFEGASA